MSERSGVEIDYCPECRGVWLDRGELDKIIDRAESELAASRPAPTAPAAPATPPVSAPPAPWGVRQPQYGAQPDEGYRNSGYGDRDRSYDNRDGYRRKKKDSWLSDLFD